MVGEAGGPGDPADGVEHPVVLADAALVEHRQHQEPMRGGRVVERVELAEGLRELLRRKLAERREQCRCVDPVVRFHRHLLPSPIELVFAFYEGVGQER